MLEMWEDQDKEKYMVTPKYLNTVTNSKGEPERQRGGSELINIDRNIYLDLEGFRERKLEESHKI